jgi:hypothetical protein
MQNSPVIKAHHIARLELEAHLERLIIAKQISMA